MSLKLTAAQLASVRGQPGTADYHGPNWAKIAAKQDRYAKLEARIGDGANPRTHACDEEACEPTTGTEGRSS
jgi:hypothetical protein